MEKKLPKKENSHALNDEQDVEMLSSFFQSRGYEAITAGSASRVLRQVETRPDLILLDINMPGLASAYAKIGTSSTATSCF